MLSYLKTLILSNTQKDLEILALRSQLALFQQEIINGKRSKPLPTKTFRLLWVIISKFLAKWKSALVIVKPETVIGWHRTAFKFFWQLKSRKRGRPKISPQTIALIKRIHKENPLLSPEKIHEQLTNLEITDAPAPNTIAKYIRTVKPPNENRQQSWRNFLFNHRRKIWAMDFLVIPTLTFKPLFVFLILSHNRRKIEHFNVTANPTSVWVAQQMREATPYGTEPKYLVHDNDKAFTSKFLQDFLLSANIKSVRTGFHCPWQNGACERLVGIIRRELLDHIIPVNEKHLTNLLHEYIHKYYNPARTHQGIECETPIPSEKNGETTIAETVLKSTPVLGGLYHSYQKVA